MQWEEVWPISKRIARSLAIQAIEQARLACGKDEEDAVPTAVLALASALSLIMYAAVGDKGIGMERVWDEIHEPILRMAKEAEARAREE